MCVCDFVQACLGEWVGEGARRGWGIYAESALQHKDLTANVRKKKLKERIDVFISMVTNICK